jgi:hypothetical protein
VDKLAQTSILDNTTEVEVAFSSGEVLGRNWYGTGQRRCFDVGHLNQRRSFPFSVECFPLRPVKPHDSEKRPARRRQPVRFLVRPGIAMPDVKGQATIRIAFKRWEHGRVDQIAIERIGREKTRRQLVKRERPEGIDRW